MDRRIQYHIKVIMVLSQVWTFQLHVWLSLFSLIKYYVIVLELNMLEVFKLARSVITSRY